MSRYSPARALLTALLLLLPASVVTAAEPGPSPVAPATPTAAPGGDPAEPTRERAQPPSRRGLDSLFSGLAGLDLPSGSAPAPPPSPAAATPPPPLPAPPAPPGVAARQEALAEYIATGTPPVLGLPTRRVYPYGHRVPVVRCLPLRVCDLAFEAGETLHGWALGDTERWITEQLDEGRHPARPHLLLKPTDYDLATSLVVVTDRRTYHLELESPSRNEVHDRDEGAGPIAYDGHLSWWYPHSFLHRVERERTEAVRREVAEQRQHDEAVALDHPLDPDDLSFAYRTRSPWRPSRRLGWKPLTLFDDGQRVYLKLPPEARRGELPVVLGLLDDGSHYPLNATLQGDWLVIPTLFDRAELVLGTGERRRSLTVVATDRNGG